MKFRGNLDENLTIFCLDFDEIVGEINTKYTTFQTRIRQSLDRIQTDFTQNLDEIQTEFVGN